MFRLIKNQINFTELVLIVSGLLFIISTIYVAFGGDLSVNYLAKGFYILGTMLLIYKF